MKKVLLLIIISLFITGCYDYYDIDKLSIISSIAIDYDNTYKLSLEILKEDNKTEIISCDGNTLGDAINTCSDMTKNHLDYSHINTVFITKNILLDDVIYYFLRNPDINNNFYLVGTDNLDIYNDINIGLSTYESLEKINMPDFFLVMHDYINNYQDVFIPTINSSFKNLFLYKDNKYVLTLEDESTNTLKILKNINNTYLINHYNNKLFELNITNSKINIDVNKEIVINSIIDTTILENKTKLDTTKTKNLKILENISNKDLEDKIYELLDLLNKENIDLLGIKRLIKNKYKKDIKINNYKVIVNTNISKKGLLLK